MIREAVKAEMMEIAVSELIGAGQRCVVHRLAVPPHAQFRALFDAIPTRRCEMIVGVSAMDDYLAGLEPTQKVALERVRGIVAGLVPDAEEGTSYGVPAFILAGRPLLGFSAAKKHLSVFPFSPAAVESVRERLDGYDLGKGTIRFSPDRPVPDDVLADLVRARKNEITAKR